MRTHSRSVAPAAALLLAGLLAPTALRAAPSDEAAAELETYIEQVLQPLMECFTGGFNQVNGVRDARSARGVVNEISRCYSRQVSGNPPISDPTGPALRSTLMGLLRNLSQRTAAYGDALDRLAQYAANAPASARRRSSPSEPSAYEQQMDRLQIDVQNRKVEAVNLGADFEDVRGRFEAWVASLRERIKQMQEKEQKAAEARQTLE